MLCQYGVDQLRDDGVVVADDAGEQRLLAAESVGEVFANFVTHGTPAHVSSRNRRFQLSEGVNAWRGRHIVYYDSLGVRDGPVRGDKPLGLS